MPAFAARIGVPGGDADVDALVHAAPAPAERRAHGAVHRPDEARAPPWIGPAGSGVVGVSVAAWICAWIWPWISPMSPSSRSNVRLHLVERGGLAVANRVQLRLARLELGPGALELGLLGGDLVAVGGHALDRDPGAVAEVASPGRRSPSPAPRSGAGTRSGRRRSSKPSDSSITVSRSASPDGRCPTRRLRRTLSERRSCALSCSSRSFSRCRRACTWRSSATTIASRLRSVATSPGELVELLLVARRARSRARPCGRCWPSSSDWRCWRAATAGPAPSASRRRRSQSRADAQRRQGGERVGGAGWCRPDATSGSRPWFAPVANARESCGGQPRT